MRRPLIRLYALLRKPGYALFVFASATHLRAYRRLLDSLVQEVNNTYGGEIVRPHVVLDKGTPEAVEAEAPVLIDFKGQFRKNWAPGTAAFCWCGPTDT
jgi:hypothetical protein